MRGHIHSLRSSFWTLAILVMSLATCYPLSAASRHAFVVGVGAYAEKSGLQSLVAPANDAEQLKNTLEKPGVEFEVDLLKNADAANKEAFNDRFNKFLAHIQPDDEVLFYFSGHGFNIPGKGNFFLLPDAKGPAVYLQGAPAGETKEAANRRYQDWLASVALSESAILDAISSHKPRVIVIIADACRSFASGGKGTGIAESNVGMVKPKENAHGVFRFYSSKAGQVSWDAPGKSKESSAENEGRGKKGEAKKGTSLFTTELLREIPVPQEINILAARVKIKVRERARDELGAGQVPDFSDSSDSEIAEATNFYFVQGANVLADRAERCRTAQFELTALGYGVGNGSVSPHDLEQKRIDLAPCGLAGEIERLARLQEQGGGQLSTSQLPNAPTQQSLLSCDQLAASPLDANRLPGTGTRDIQKVSLSTLSGGIERAVATTEIGHTIDICKAAVAERSRVARLKYNLGRGYYALASISESIARQEALKQASKYFTEAVDLGYAAAYNSLASLYQNGEYYAVINNNLIRQAPDHDRATELLRRGAALGDVLAQYSLGMAYKNGELRFDGDPGTAEKGVTYLRGVQALAFQWLSKAAESGYVPAMIETAAALYNGWGIEPNRTRAIELLEIASSRGSWEAMYMLGDFYRREATIPAADGIRDPEVAKSKAIVWIARAAEAGDARSQRTLAELLTDGEGLPAPQPEAAARYWRLAAEQGDIAAQVELARLLRKGKIQFRPNSSKPDKKPDGGAQEIFDLYSTAFARGMPAAGYELATLFRSGFPAPDGSDTIPKLPERAVSLLWTTMDRVKQADPDSEDANPRYFYLSAFELIKMYDAGEAKRADGSSIMLQDQVDQLRVDFGDPEKLVYVQAANFGPINCHGKNSLWVAIWDRKSKEPPTEEQFNWWERRYSCKLKKIEEKEKDKGNSRQSRRREREEELGVSEKVRNTFNREFEAWLKGNEEKDSKKPQKPFTDRIVAMVSKTASK